MINLALVLIRVIRTLMKKMLVLEGAGCDGKDFSSLDYRISGTNNMMWQDPGASPGRGRNFVLFLLLSQGFHLFKFLLL